MLPGLLTHTFTTHRGEPYVGLQVTVLLAGTTTPGVIFSDVAGLTQISNVLTTDSRGTINAYGFGHYDLVPGTSATVNGQSVTLPTGQSVRRSALGEGAITPMRFGAVGNGTINDALAINTAIAVARTIASADVSYGNIEVDFAGRTYGILSEIDLRTANNVTLKNGGLRVLDGFTGTRAINIVVTGSGASVRDVSLQHISIDARRLCSGVVQRAARNVTMDNCRIVHTTDYGIHVQSGPPNTLKASKCEVQGWYFSDPEADDYTQRTGIGIAIESADCVLTDCNPFYFKYPLYINGAFGLSINGCHPFNGAAPTPQVQIASVGVNGSGRLRINTTTAHGYTTGDRIIVPFLSGLSAENGFGGSNVFDCVVVDADTVDFPDAVITTGTWGGGTVSLSRWEDEPIACYITKDNGKISIKGMQLDNGKLVIEATNNGNQCIDGDVWCLRNSDGYNRCQIEILVTEANSTLAGINLTNVMFQDTPKQIRYNIDGGSLSSDLRCVIGLSYTTDGTPPPAAGRMALPGGTRTRPGVQFTDVTVPDNPTTANSSGLGANPYPFFSAESFYRLRVLSDGVDFGDVLETADQRAAVDASATQNASYEWKMGGVVRWRLQRNTTGNLVFQARDSGGSFLGNDLTIENATGRVVIGADSRTGTRLRINSDETTTDPGTTQRWLACNVNGQAGFLMFKRA